MTLAWLGAGVVLLGLFALVETKIASSPLVPFSFFKNRTVSATNFVMFLIGAAFFSMWYFLTLYYQEVQGWSALKTGFAFAPQAIAIIVGAQVATRLMPRIGAWPIIVFGTSAATVGFFFLGHLTPDSSYVGVVLAPALLISLALGLLFSPLAAAATFRVSRDKAGLASGVLNTSRQIGGSLGLAVLATIAVDATKSVLPGFNPNFSGAPTTAEKLALTHGYNQAFLWASAICLAGVLATMLIPRDVARPVPTAVAETVG